MKTIEDLRESLQAATPEVRAIAKMIADGLLTIVVTAKGNDSLTWTPEGARWYAEIVAIGEAQEAQAATRTVTDADLQSMTADGRPAFSEPPKFVGTTPSPEGEYR